MNQWLAMLGREGLLPRHAGRPSPEEFTVALYAYLTRTPAVLIGVSLADAAGERRPQNMPGTVDEYPNWRIPLTGADGRPVLLDDLPAHAGVRAVAGAVSGGLRGEQNGVPRLAGGAPRSTYRRAASGSDGTGAGPPELGIGLYRAGARAAEPGHVGRAVLGVLAEGLESLRQHVPEGPQAQVLV